MAGGVRASNLKGRCRIVDRVNFRHRQFLGQCESNTARARADVGDANTGGQIRRYTLNDGLNHKLSLRPWDENSRRDDKIHAPEFLMASYVLGGNSPGALGENGFIAGGFVVSEFVLWVGIEVCAVAAQSKHEKHFGVHSRGRNSFPCKSIDRRRDRLL